MPPEEAQNDSACKDGYLFLGNQLTLDFLNTRPVQNDEPIELLPNFAALLCWFQAAGLLGSVEVANLQRQWGQSSVARRVADAMRELRERLRKQVLRWENGEDIQHSMIDELNRWMAEHPMRSRLKANGKRLSAELYFEAQSPQDLFAPLAHSAAMLFGTANRERVRKCDQCALQFLDTSKKGTRRWCSMQLCGNRLKVAAYAARKRATKTRE